MTDQSGILTQYKAVIFDLDNTLLNFNSGERQAILGALSACSISIMGIGESRFLETFETFNSKYWHQSSRLPPGELIARSYQDTFSELGMRAVSCEELSRHYWHIFNHTGDLEENAYQVLSLLSGKYRLAVLTNGLKSSQSPRMKAAGIEHFFEAVVVSEAVGYAKPAPQIFHYILRALNLAASDVLYIGDSLKHDYEGAKQVGIDFCYYNRNRESLPEEVQPAFIAEDLMEIVAIVS